MSDVLMTAAFERSDAPASDDDLVAAVRRGEDRAFACLYERYQRRIHAYVLGMVKDHGRAEDVTQEVFVAALRRMRATERPIAFKPWVYEIAKNACIDQFRRSRRADEVSIDAGDGPGAVERLRLAGTEPTPDAALAAKEQLEDLCGAFGGLSDIHHRILVMRELEGRSYQEIGRELGMTRPAVESTLFRARRRLTEEYDELASGARCLRVQDIIARAGEARLGTRDARRLARHVAHCQPCRREALAAGLDEQLTRRPVRERIAAKVAGLLPFPGLLRLRGGRDDGEVAAGPSLAGARAAAHVPAVAEQLSSGWAKLAAGAALVVGGVGVGSQVAPADPARPAPRAAHVAAPAAGGESAAAARSVALRATVPARRAETRHARAERTDGPRGTTAGGAAVRRSASTGGERGGAPAAAPRDVAVTAVSAPAVEVASAPGASAPSSPSPPAASAPAAPAAPSVPSAPAVRAPSRPSPPSVTAPSVASPPALDPVEGVVDGAVGALPSAPTPVGHAVRGTKDAAGSFLGG